MILHVLPGDSIVSTFEKAGIEGEIAVCREALVEGDLGGDSLPEFWENRARHFARQHAGSADNYHETVVREFAKLTALQSGSEINLWFEYELFCQTNMWFCMNLLSGSTADIFRVVPVVRADKDMWDGFANLPPDDLNKCYAARERLSVNDIDFGAELWSAYRDANYEDLERLSEIESAAFPKLREVCLAAIEQESRPKEILKAIIDDGVTEFDDVFREFKAKAGVYGFGDAQVRKLWQTLLV
jgi:hypothetical protein